MPTYKDVEVRIRGPKAGNNGQGSLHDVEVRVEGSGLWIGSSKLDFDSLDPSDPQQYGAALGNQLANPSLLRAFDQSGLTRGDFVRLRLLLDDDVNAPHWIRWERIWIPIDGLGWPLAAHPNVAFSRYIPVERPDEDPPDTPFFRLLYAVANPDGLKPCELIDVEAEINNFMRQFEGGPADRRLQVSILPGRTGISTELKDRIAKQGWSLLAGNTTLQMLSDHLHERFHGLHILAHGDFNPDTSIGSLLLENEAGGKTLVNDTELQSWITLDLQLVVFQSCLSGAGPAEGHTPYTGLAPHLIRLGVPAAVAMQDYVAMNDARIFFTEFYRSLLNDGAVDVAVNHGRQVLKDSAASDNWSIPALFSRLRGGRLWRADRLRQALVEVLGNLPEEDGLKAPVMQAIEHTRGVANYDPIQGAAGPRFDLARRLGELAAVPDRFTILTGGRGFSKATELQCLFRDCAKKFLRGDAGVAMPVLLSLPELAGHQSDSWPILPRIWAGEGRNGDSAELDGRQFLFLIDGAEELAGGTREIALDAVKRLRALSGSSICLVADDPLIPALRSEFEDSTLLVAQPLDWPHIAAYLQDVNTDSARALQKQIQQRDYVDVASQPRFLQHMLQLTARGVPLPSRRRVFERICATYLARVDTDHVPRCCVEDALRRIAWGVQTGRGSDLQGTDLYAILNSARAGREFALSDLMRALVEECKLLVPSGDEGVRFAYPTMQCYFAAQYLANAPDRTRSLEDITASLGRLTRIRRWDKALVLLASMLPCPGDLLRTVLAGSPLLEGEQVFLAVRCYQEAVAERQHTSDMDDVVDQMVDSLIWRSSWDPRRAYADRQKALRSLVALATLYKPRQADIIPHLIALACDPIPSKTATSTREHYDWAGIRQAAATGAARLFEETSKYIHENRPDLLDPLSAWWKLADNADALRCLLMRDDPRVSVIAAFALGQSQREEDRQALISAYDRVSDLDVKWGIAEALGGLEAIWVCEQVVAPWIQRAGDAAADASEVQSAHICYLIQTTSYATPEVRNFLSGCLLNGSPWLQGRALRALAKLQDEDIETWLCPLCEGILACNPDEVDATKLNTTEDEMADATLQRSALEALRDIGDSGSLDVIRSSRALHCDNYELRQLSFQVAEEIYWRLTGGLDRESFTGAAFRTSQGE